MAFLGHNKPSSESEAELLSFEWSVPFDLTSVGVSKDSQWQKQDTSAKKLFLLLPLTTFCYNSSQIGPNFIKNASQV